MKTRLVLALAFLCSGSALFSQTHTTDTLEDAQTVTGAKTFTAPVTATGNISVGGTLGVTGKSTQPNINNRIYVDGVKYPITRAGIQSAFTDACAIQNGAGSGGVTVYLPANMLLSINGTTDANSATEIFLITCALNVQGGGIFPTQIRPVTAASSSQAVIRVKPTSTASQGKGRFTGFQILGDGSEGDGIVFDGSALNTSAGGPNEWEIDHTYITGLGTGSRSVSLVTCQVTCNQGKFEIRDNRFDNGLQFGGGSAGDSILIEHNIFTALTGSVPCVDMNLQTGSALLTVFNNNGGCAGGFFVGHAGQQCKILYNQIEQTVASTEANSAIIDIQGDIGTIEACEIRGNNLNAHTSATNNIRLDHAVNTMVQDNVITVKATTGVGVLLTANPSGTRIPWNDFIGLGGGAIAWSNPSSTSIFFFQTAASALPLFQTSGASTSQFGFNQELTLASSITFATANVNRFFMGNAGGLVSTLNARSDGVYGFSASTTPTNASDTGLSRVAANVLGAGSGASADVSGEFRSAKISATYNAAGTVQTAVHIVQDSGALSSGTPSTATITLAGSAVYTSNATYNCSATNKTTQANNLKISYTNGSTFVVTGPNTVTDAFSFVCVGN